MLENDQARDTLLARRGKDLHRVVQDFGYFLEGLLAQSNRPRGGKICQGSLTGWGVDQE